MYTNIDTDHALKQLKTAFDRFKDKLPPDFPTDLVLEALGIIMKNNVFQFGDTIWLQLNGTAMGTPPACTWETIYYGVHESMCILANFGQNLLYCGVFIDDMLGIWIPDDSNPNAWEEFKASLPFVSSNGKPPSYQPRSTSSTSTFPLAMIVAFNSARTRNQ